MREVQHFRAGGNQRGIGADDFSVVVVVHWNFCYFKSNKPAGNGLLKGFYHRSIVLVANNDLVARLPLGTHDNDIEALSGIAGECNFFWN